MFIICSCPFFTAAYTFRIFPIGVSFDLSCVRFDFTITVIEWTDGNGIHITDERTIPFSPLSDSDHRGVYICRYRVLGLPVEFEESFRILVNGMVK